MPHTEEDVRNLVMHARLAQALLAELGGGFGAGRNAPSVAAANLGRALAPFGEVSEEHGGLENGSHP